MEASQVKALEAIVAKLKEDPSLYYTPELAPFKEYLTSLGATIPKPSSGKAEEKSAATPEPASAPAAKEPEESEEPEEPEEEDPEQMAEDSPPFPEKGPEGEVELTDEQMDKQADLQGQAAEAAEDGDFAKAVEKFTEVIKIGNATAKMYAKRGQFLLKGKRPAACVADCDAAIGINPNNALAYRVRGLANRYLGRWEQAQMDLSKGMQLDFDAFDDDAEASKAKKVVADRYHQLQDKQVKRRLKEEKKRADDIKRRKEEAQRIYEEQKKQEASGGGFPGMGGMGGFPGMPGGMGGFPGGMPGGMPGGGMPGGMPGGMDPSMFAGMMNDPDFMSAFQNPKVMAAFQDILSNPANISKYQSDPEVMAIMQKMMGKFGGMGGMPGGMGGGFPGAGGDGAGASGGAAAGATVEEVNEADEVD